MKVNDIVKFKDIIEKGDDLISMRVLEIRGDRVLVESLVNMAILPVAVYPINTLIVTKPINQS